jgi:hypothetical protein
MKTLIMRKKKKIKNQRPKKDLKISKKMEDAYGRRREVADDGTSLLLDPATGRWYPEADDWADDPAHPAAFVRGGKGLAFAEPARPFC